MQLNEKNPGYWQKYSETKTTPKKPDLVGKNPAVATLNSKLEQQNRRPTSSHKLARYIYTIIMQKGRVVVTRRRQQAAVLPIDRHTGLYTRCGGERADSVDEH